VLVTNIPVIILSKRSDRLKDDVVGKVMASLCFADIAVGTLPSAVSFILAWIQPHSVPTAVCAFQVRTSCVNSVIINIKNDLKRWQLTLN